MKKTRLLTLLLALILGISVVFSGCRKEADTEAETEEVTLTIENLTDKDYTYDAGQRLEIWQDGHWCVIPDKQDFVTMQLFTLPGNATDEVTFNFVNHYDKLGDGRYRIVMNFSSMDGSTAIAAAEFGIGRAEK